MPVLLPLPPVFRGTSRRRALPRSSSGDGSGLNLILHRLTHSEKDPHTTSSSASSSPCCLQREPGSAPALRPLSPASGGLSWVWGLGGRESLSS